MQGNGCSGSGNTSVGDGEIRLSRGVALGGAYCLSAGTCAEQSGAALTDDKDSDAAGNVDFACGAT